jgi:hypothetical protein
MWSSRDKTLWSAFVSMGSLYEGWVNGDERACRRLPTRIFYEAVGKTITGYKSRKATQANSQKNNTDDHFAMPQWIGRFIMDNGHIYLKDFDRFKEIAVFAAQTIRVTKKENRILSLQTSEISAIDGVNVFIETSVRDKYKKAGIMLWDKKEGWIDDFPIIIPEEILIYERQFLRNE